MDAARLDKVMVPPSAAIRDAVEAIDAGAVEIALVVDEERRLLGTITDGDVRRAMLRGVDLDGPIDEVIHREPVTASTGAAREELLGLMTERGVEQIPLVDDDGRVEQLAFLREIVAAEEAGPDSPVVVMAGGEGQRLRPLTEDRPKPMLEIGGRPLLETTLDQVREAGFSRVLIAVNYKADQIQEHFGSGESRGLEISYIREEEAMGSAGAIRLAPGELDRPFILINGDLLTKVNLGALLRFHREEGNAITVGVRKFKLQIPYGVVEIEGTAVTEMKEKPQMEVFVNAGVYAVSPEAVALVPEDRDFFHATDIVNLALDAGRRVGSFPIREYWLDIGHLSDYERAEDDHATHFSAGEREGDGERSNAG
jgi:dTDP-glucose pyrophosphorylase/CBS domain-containing protein